jgi:hypothetical protein
MTNRTSKSKTKQLSKGQRKHVRRLKQAARKEGSTYSLHSSPAQPVRVHKQQDQS